MDSHDWDARYVKAGSLWGSEPNAFVVEQLADVSASGRALDLACGEGRNAVWLAKQGWDVTAIDFSSVAIERARELADENNVTVAWEDSDVTDYTPPVGEFGLVVLTYLHLPPEQRHAVLGRAADALAETGLLLVVGHSRRNLTEGVGGPQDPTVLLEPSELEDELRTLGFDIVHSEYARRELEVEDLAGQAIDTVVLARRPARA